MINGNIGLRPPLLPQSNDSMINQKIRARHPIALLSHPTTPSPAFESAKDRHTNPVGLAKGSETRTGGLARLVMLSPTSASVDDHAVPGFQLPPNPAVCESCRTQRFAASNSSTRIFWSSRVVSNSITHKVRDFFGAVDLLLTSLAVCPALLQCRHAQAPPWPRAPNNSV